MTLEFSFEERLSLIKLHLSSQEEILGSFCEVILLDKGKKAICKPNCGRKICYVDVKTHAENVLNNEIQKLRGTVQIGYDFITDSVNNKKRVAKLREGFES